MCNHYTQKSALISVCFCKISVAIRKYLRISLIFARILQIHTPYMIYIFHYYLIPALDYTVIISLYLHRIFPWLYGYISFFYLHRIFSGLYGYHFFFLFAPYFCRDCTVIISFLYLHRISPGLYGYYFFSFICTVFLRDCTVIILFFYLHRIFPKLYGYHLFFLICTVFLPKLYGYYFFSFICTVFLSNVSSKYKKIREALNSTLPLLFMNAADRNRTGTGITTHGILSPGRLPVPPLRHI